MNVIIDVFANSNQFQDCVQADDAQLIHTQRNCTVVKSTAYVKYALIGALIGAVVAVVIAVLAYMLDNTIKDKNELEEITGTHLLSYIEMQKPIKAK